MAKKTAVKKAAKATTPKAETDVGVEKFSTALVPMPKPNAMSLGVGMTALALIEQYATNAQQVDELNENMVSTRGKANVVLTMAVHKLATLDRSIDLAVYVGNDKSAKERVGKQIRIALGVMKREGDKIVLTPDADAKLNKQPGDDPRTLSRKKTVRVKYSNAITTASRAALHCIENNIKPEVTNTGHLRLTDGRGGKAVQQHFGEASVVLNEQQNVKMYDKKGNEIGDKTLKAKPSFTEVTRKVGAAHGQKIVARKDSRTQALDPNQYIVNVANDLTKAIAGIQGKVIAPVEAALKALQNAIDKAIG